MKELRYVGPHDEVTVSTATSDIVVKRGETAEFPDEVVSGRPSKGDPEKDPENFDPGTLGLLAQNTEDAVAWEEVEPAPKGSPKKTKGGED